MSKKNGFAYLRTVGLAVGLGVMALAATSSAKAAEVDACAGQSWPNLSEACIDQIVKKVCEAGGGGSTCGSSSSTTVSRAQFNQYVALEQSGPITRRR